MSIEELRALDKFIQENEQRGYIRKSYLSAGYYILIILKKSGKWRVCIDYRQLNEVTIKDRMLLSKINETLNQI